MPARRWRTRPTARSPTWWPRYAMPRALPDALLEGFAWDAAGPPLRDARGAARLRRAGRRQRRRDDGAADGRARAGRWRAPATSASRCSSPTSRATSARTRAPAGSTCRAVAARGRHRPRRLARRARVQPRPSARWCSACCAAADALYARADAGIARLPLACRPASAPRADLRRDRPRGGAGRLRQRLPTAPSCRGSRKLVLLAQARRAGAARAFGSGRAAAPSRPGSWSRR